MQRSYAQDPLGGFLSGMNKNRIKFIVDAGCGRPLFTNPNVMSLRVRDIEGNIADAGVEIQLPLKAVAIWRWDDGQQLFDNESGSCSTLRLKCPCWHGINVGDAFGTLSVYNGARFETEADSSTDEFIKSATSIFIKALIPDLFDGSSRGPAKS